MLFFRGFFGNSKQLYAKIAELNKDFCAVRLKMLSLVEILAKLGKILIGFVRDSRNRNYSGKIKLKLKIVTSIDNASYKSGPEIVALQLLHQKLLGNHE